MSKNVDTNAAAITADQPECRDKESEQRVPGTLSLFAGKPEPTPGRSPLFRR
jgi:hypothetical protein